MSDRTGIEWSDATWNPIRGCSAVSPGCANCYAAGVAARFSGDGQPFEGLAKRSKGGKPQWTGEVRMIPEKLDQPLRWKRPRRIFVNSVSDLFHEALSDEQIAAVFGAMAAAPQHTFQVLTKRAKRMLEWFRSVDSRAAGIPGGDGEVRGCVWHADRLGGTSWHAVRRHIDYPAWPLPNVHLGVSCENQATADERIPLLLRCPAAVRWVSAEPLLRPVNFDVVAEKRLPSGEWDQRWRPLRGFFETYQDPSGPYRHETPKLGWVVVGGESGRGHRPCEVEWIQSIADQCSAAGVPCFVKQDSGPRSGMRGRLSDDLWAMKELPA